MKLGPKTRDILELILLVGTDALTSLPLRNYHSLAGWESEHALRRQLRAMQNRGLITLNGENPADWVPQITKVGRRLARNEIDPQVAWSTPLGRQMVHRFFRPSSRSTLSTVSTEFMAETTAFRTATREFMDFAQIFPELVRSRLPN